MTIPTRQRVVEPISGPGELESVAVHDVGGLRDVELVAGELPIALKTGETYQFPITELLDGQ